jgi:thymidylate synthase
MHIIARGVSEALYVGLLQLKANGKIVESRAGETLEMTYPVMTTYLHPRERVLFYPQRDANPFFHLFEALWMLGGRNDVEFVARYNKRMAEYSDDGQTFNGAYGYRWRSHFGYDQLEVAIHRLKTYPNDRRTVVAMWDPGHRDDYTYAMVEGDLTDINDTKDLPCNTHIYFKVRDGALNMTVCCRSNDIIWGAYGANAVHFSILQEYVAARVGVRVGTYTQLSDSYHAYTAVLAKLDGMKADYDPYLSLGKDGLHYIPEPMFSDIDGFHYDLETFLEKKRTLLYKTEFFRSTVAPMDTAWHWFKYQKDLDKAMECASHVAANDWRKACIEWLERRRK